MAEVALARWGARLPQSGGRFASPGWSYEEPVGRSCPRCGGVLHSLRKPYQSAGRQYHYVALVCPLCPNAFTLADLALKVYKDVQQPAGAAAPHSPAAPLPQQAPGEAARQAAILRFWRSVEFFAVQTLERPDARSRRYAPRAGEPLPWDSGHPLQRQLLGPDFVWQHTVYGGIFSLDRVHGTLKDVFGSSDEDVDERVPRGHSALFAVSVTADGRLLLDSLVVSTGAWAVGRSRHPGPSSASWLDGFEVDCARHAERVREVVAAADDDAVATTLAEQGVAVSRPVAQEALQKLVALTTEQLRVGILLEPLGLRVHSHPVHRKRAHEVQTDFLNSFFADDLQLVADAVAGGDCGQALRDYLSDDKAVTPIARVDVLEARNDDVLLAQLAPDRVPAGRWPAKVEHPLATSQQLAIDAIVESLGERAGAFAVNGPPGTGKTTMLRELVAALVVKRATSLAQLRAPAAAFRDDVVGWSSGKYQRRIRPLRDEFTGYEMVVASANNGAVANVTREIPRIDSIDSEMRDRATYLRQHATRVLGEPAWGLIAAALGNKSNRSRFVSRFWYGQPADTKKASGEEGPGFQEWLKEAQTSAERPWSAAVAAFHEAAVTEQRARQVRQEAHEALGALPDLVRAHDGAGASLQQHGRRQRLAAEVAQTADAATVQAQQVADSASARRQEHRSLKPGVWEMVFTFGRAIRRWHAEDEELAVAAGVAASAAASAANTAVDARRAVEEAALIVAAASVACREAARRVAEGCAAVEEGRSRCGAQVPDVEWLGSGEQRELKAPWLDDQWNLARTDLFIAALQLHEAFLAGAAKIMAANLRAAMDVLGGQAPADAPEPAVRAAWQSLFLVVPVVSTTFASVARLLRPLGREALGWLLVDEAGQAAPQLAAGAVWRARRLVTVGDPLQLEPVVTVLHTTQQALRRHHGVAQTWLPGCTSVQALTDRITPIGTMLPGPQGERVWVGAPLRVHRRCDNPMFDIVNSEVYDGLMIHGRAPRDEPLTITPSAWIDVVSTEAEGHWIPEEGRAAEQFLAYLEGKGVLPSQIMVITPFRESAVHLRALVRRYPELTCGTIHVAQGKEADVVVLVLGGHPARPGARAWAAGRPNLFNVAVSRAKQRLYVVGSHDRWAPLPYFSTLAQALPRRFLRDTPALTHRQNHH